MIHSLQIKPPVIAHRGASAYAPENTLSSFTRAAQLGIQWVEFDVMLAACGTPIVFHDETLDRTTDRQGDIGGHPYRYLQTLDAGAWFHSKFAGERIPTLAQVLALLKEAGMCANVEIKPLPGQDKETILATLKTVSTYFTQPNTSILFSSFSIDALKYLREASKECLIGFLMHDWLDDWKHVADELQCVSMNVNEEIMTKERAQAIKQAGYQLLCYTVNHAERAKELYSWGVDAVFSDCPDKVLG